MSNNVKKTVISALLVALGVALPFTLHSIPQSGQIFLLMHIPVLMCGLICGAEYGLACGILTPLLSSLLTGMPPAAVLPSMLVELAVYGLFAGLLIKLVKTKRPVLDLYLSLLSAMLAGRLVFGAVNALIFKAGEYSMNVWMTAAFVTALPGIAIQIVLIPVLILALKRSRLIQM